MRVPSPHHRLRSIVIIDPDLASQEWLKQELLPTGRPVRGFLDVESAQAHSDLHDVAAILVSIDADAAKGDDVAQPVRTAACWVRGAAAPQPPGVFALARRALAPSAMQAALHRGASLIITVDQMLVLRELVEAQLRAREAWYPMADSGFMMAAEGAESDSAPQLAAQSTAMKSVTLTPRSKTADLPVHEHGWIPGRKDFEITEADPIDLKLYESKAVLRAIAAADGNRTLAAQLLGIGKSTLYRRLSEWRSSLAQ